MLLLLLRLPLRSWFSLLWGRLLPVSVLPSLSRLRIQLVSLPTWLPRLPLACQRLRPLGLSSPLAVLLCLLLSPCPRVRTLSSTSSTRILQRGLHLSLLPPQG